MFYKVDKIPKLKIDDKNKIITEWNNVQNHYLINVTNGVGIILDVSTGKLLERNLETIMLDTNQFNKEEW